MHINCSQPSFKDQAPPKKALVQRSDLDVNTGQQQYKRFQNLLQKRKQTSKMQQPQARVHSQRPSVIDLISANGED